MLTVTMQKMKDLRGFKIGATDGEIGKIDDFYFDDQNWKIRYLIANTGNWLMDRKVLISPSAFQSIDTERRLFNTSLTQEKVKDAPPIDMDRPVSRHKEMELSLYYAWPIYWGNAALIQPKGVAASRMEPAFGEDENADSHLRSANAVSGYTLHAVDGEIGHVDDFFINDTDWSVAYIVVDTHKWLPGRKVIISPQWVNRIRWDKSTIDVDLTRKAVKASPEPDLTQTPHHEYEERLFRHYGKKRRD